LSALKSKFTALGEMTTSLPELPKLYCGASTKALVSNQWFTERSSEGRLPLAMRFGRALPVLAELVAVSGVIGCPEWTVVIPFNCQSPATAFSARFVMLKRCPCPNGRSYM